jgi:hypothetical protein
MYKQVGNGLFVLSGKIVDYLDRLEKVTYKMGELFNSERIWTPSHLSVENSNTTGYKKSFPNQASLIYSMEGHEKGLCSPTVCYHCYSMLRDTHHPENKSYMMTGKCTRIEEHGGDTLERLFNFTISEIVFVGTKKYCEKSLSDAIFYTKQMLDGFGLQYYLELASDPFFGNKARLKEKVQLQSGSKIEIRAEIPNENRTVAIGSFNFHGKKFVENFSIHGAVTTACFGWGLERFIHVMMLQKGNKLLTELNWDSFQKDNRKIKEDLRLNFIDDNIGWYYVDGDKYWFCEKDIREVEDGNNEDGFVVIDSMEKVNKYEQELKLGIENMHVDLSDWPERWDFEELKNRINNGCIIYVNILDGKAVQWQWFSFGDFILEDHGRIGGRWKLDVKLPENNAFSEHWWVEPKYRLRRNFFHNFYRNQWSDLKNRGIEVDVSYVDGWNRKAIGCGKKFGYVGSDWINDKKRVEPNIKGKN